MWSWRILYPELWCCVNVVYQKPHELCWILKFFVDISCIKKLFGSCLHTRFNSFTFCLPPRLKSHKELCCSRWIKTAKSQLVDSVSYLDSGGVLFMFQAWYLEQMEERKLNPWALSVSWWDTTVTQLNWAGVQPAQHETVPHNRNVVWLL